MGEGEGVGELQMDNNFMEPPGEELRVTFSPLKVHCL